MSKVKVVEIPNHIEPSTELVEVFESAEDRTRREWAENSGDWAHFILQFLQGHRRNEISLSEIEQTRTYARANELEKNALRWVAGQAEQKNPLSDEDRRRLTERDDFLMKFVEGASLGHRDWQTEIKSIPSHVAEREKFDRVYFRTMYRQPVLFSWIWSK